MFTVNTDIPNAPEITLTPDVAHLGMDNFTVILEWPQFSGETYTVATLPEALHTSIMNNSCHAQLVLLYDIEYNVTVTATLCGNSNTTNSTTLPYYCASKNQLSVPCHQLEYSCNKYNNLIGQLEGPLFHLETSQLP